MPLSAFGAGRWVKIRSMTAGCSIKAMKRGLCRRAAIAAEIDGSVPGDRGNHSRAAGDLPDAVALGVEDVEVPCAIKGDRARSLEEDHRLRRSPRIRRRPL